MKNQQVVDYQGSRVAIIDGVRTPFARQSSELKALSAIDLGAHAVKTLLNRYDVKENEVDQIVFGQVIPKADAPNIAREIALICGMGDRVDAFSVSRACATSQQALICAVQNICSGSIESAIVGGADSASNLPFTWSAEMGLMALSLFRAKTLPQKLQILRNLKLSHLIPSPPPVAEFSTGLSMGQTAEQMAKTFAISRLAQDEYAHRSHILASNAWQDSLLCKQVEPIHPHPHQFHLTEDNVLRHSSQLSDYAKLRPVFDRHAGTVTAGNSSALTDGGAALFVVREDTAKAMNLPVLGYIRAYDFCAISVKKNMLLGPAYSIPRVLEKAGMSIKDIELMEMHEAFAAQVLANLACLSSDLFAQQQLGRSQAVGDIDPTLMNIQGGSLAYGHPFAATGARMITQLLYQLKRSGKGIGLVASCAAGGIGSSIILESE
ncbi:acetyl-CoA C-acyltransferase FadI [Vibrio sp.]|uniref:Acetyl-CoA C-acyltransferase FadI n=1 Tax=Vibrio viridaestus TaxID=2487322 RepID=A0A3N9U540_9VIBR|nr:acetyl-CoA C-acyltransferase FadI [Vibrio viridaestus]MDC0611515.1 acetyl-CoA C-acyltransferase FadI [Vibrio sp.]RQW63156.1 acetyl-CoA C-acyltransferase FadI [Vibrio viridaestus]